MKYRGLRSGVLILGFTLPRALGIIYTRGVGQRGIQVADVDDRTFVDEEKQLIEFHDPDSEFTRYMGCNRAKGTSLTWSADGKWVGCCYAGQKLKGSAKTGFQCCGTGHDLVGDMDVGFRCCPRGQEFDGEKCKDPPPVCTNGKVLVDGKCVCPAGTVEVADGSCQKPKPPACSSEITSGSCYLFKMANGEYLGYNNKGWYSASRPSSAFQPGKFKFCKNEWCTEGSPVNPGDGVRVQDLHGEANSGKDSNHWLNGAQNGGHIGKTPDYRSAGVFSITKWTTGKYCLGGFNSGAGPTCPSDDPAVTFNTFDKQSCVPAELVPVPCDIRDVDNNCLWTGEKKNPCPAGKTCTPISGGGQGATPPVQCPDGATWNGYACIVTTVACPPGSIWNGKKCISKKGSSGGPCPPGQPWKDGRCFLPITDCADRVRPEFGDTSYNPADFPCSNGRETPCRGDEVKTWTEAVLPWGGSYVQPGPPKPLEIEVDYSFDVMMTLVGTQAQSEHFLVKLDGEFLGETGGEDGYKNLYTGYYNDPEWCLVKKYTRGYFRIPRGEHTITIEWPQGTGKYKSEGGGAWGYGVGQYRFDRLCDPQHCLSACAERKQREAEEARVRTGISKHGDL